MEKGFDLSTKKYLTSWDEDSKKPSVAQGFFCELANKDLLYC